MHISFTLLSTPFQAYLNYFELKLWIHFIVLFMLHFALCMSMYVCLEIKIFVFVFVFVYTLLQFFQPVGTLCVSVTSASSSSPVAYPELVSGGVSKSRKSKWLMKVDARNDYTQWRIQGVFWLPGNPPPGHDIFFNEGVTPYISVSKAFKKINYFMISFNVFIFI